MNRVMTPSEIGARAEIAVAHALANLGKLVLAPLFAAHLRYDLAFEDAAGIHRVQVKSGRARNGVIQFASCSHTNNVQASYEGEADFFGVYCHELRSTYLIPVTDVPTNVAHLRLVPSKNNQRKGIRWADDYRISGQEPCPAQPNLVTWPDR